MASEEEINFRTAFEQIREEFKAKTKKAYINDLEGQLYEKDNIWEHVSKTKKKENFVCVTFDRHKNDRNFSYQYADLTLVLLDRISGGTGIYKPANQMRALQWNSTRAGLLLVLRYLANNNSIIKFNRILVLPFPIPPIGVRINQKIHMK